MRVSATLDQLSRRRPRGVASGCVARRSGGTPRHRKDRNLRRAPLSFGHFGEAPERFTCCLRTVS